MRISLLMKNLLEFSKREHNLINIGNKLFLIGVFFLPSSLFISLLFLLPAGIIGSLRNERKFFKDHWNLIFFVCGALILFNSILQNYYIKNDFQEIWNSNLSFIGLANWLPFFWLFWAFQPFVNSSSRRKKLALVLISGTLPVVISGFTQYFLNWYGPFKILNGLIVWYQKPIIDPGGLSGLFSNQNYAGSWFNFIWPLCIALILEKSENIIKKIISISFLFSIGFSAFLTNSRNAWLGLITTTPLVIGQTSIKFLIPILIIFALFFLYALLPIFESNFQEVIINIIPKKILMEFSSEGYKDLDVTRFQILINAIKILRINPIFGVGAASFTAIYQFQSGFWKGHSHNLPIELAISYGLPVAIIFFTTLFLILFLSGHKLFFKNLNLEYFDRAIWASTFFFFISQFVDIQYFDGKISILSWIFLSSLRNMINEK
mgnify:CR=1 FL=1